jgi:flavin reductase (DIM6/NTAB) family NADH-FMN oxidoreductase RutF
MSVMENAVQGFEEFDFSAMPTPDRYKVLASVVLPRPIAWVVSRNASGALNAAPFSFFNAVGAAPPLIMFSVTSQAGHWKDTLNNVRASGEFVVNLVPEDLAQQMNITAVNAPAGVDETQLAGLEMMPSKAIGVPRIAGSPVALECRLYKEIELGANVMVIGEVLHAAVRSSAFANRERLYIDPDRLQLIGRMAGAGGYCRTRDQFTMDRPVWPMEPAG